MPNHAAPDASAIAVAPYVRPVPYRYPTSPEQIAENNHAAGFKWFEASNMRFFRCRVGSRLHYNWPDFPGFVWFVTSEAHCHDPRRYTVRVHCVADGSVETVGHFQEWPTAQAAHRAAALAAREGRTK